MVANIFHIQKFSLHDGPGLRTSVFFQGCNLHCQWCANPECHQAKKTPIALEELLREVLKDKPFYDKSHGGVTLTGGEVLLQLPFALEFCQKLHDHGIHIAMETAGAVPLSTFQSLATAVDFVYLDCKHYDSEKHRAGTGVSNHLILGNIQWLAQSGIPHCIRIPVIPGFNDSLEDATAFADLLMGYGVEQVELLPFHQMGQGKYESMELDYAYAQKRPYYAEDLRAYEEIFTTTGLQTILK